VTAEGQPLLLALHDYPPVTGGGLALAARDLSRVLEPSFRTVILSSRLKDHFADDRRSPELAASSALARVAPVRLGSLLRQADLLVSHWTFSFRPLATLAVLIAPTMGKRTVCVVHTAPDHCLFNRLRWMPGGVRARLVRAFGTVARSRCEAVVALSPEHADALFEAGFPITHVAPLPVGGVGIETAYRHHVSSARPPEVVGFVGEVSRLKGADALPGLMNTLTPRYALHIVGEGPLLQSTIGAARDLPPARRRRVLFDGKRAPSEMGDIYRELDCVLVLSRTESQSRVTIEAMLSGVIALVSPEARLGHVVIDNVTGLVIDPYRPATVLNKLHHLAASPTTAAGIRARARQHALDLVTRSSAVWNELIRGALGP
jgi:glycosyltransferase involved in cell wall biosynthesis